HLLASAIGAASSRLALSLLLRRRNVSTKAALKLLDDASAAIQYSRDLLQHAIDHARQGITVLDQDLHLLAWNRAFIDLYESPPRRKASAPTRLWSSGSANARRNSRASMRLCRPPRPMRTTRTSRKRASSRRRATTSCSP